MAPRMYDLLVIGGGIHGSMIALRAAEEGYRVGLVERDKCGRQTSAAWFGILHGGLRYLQSLDIPRLRQSLTDRRWFLQNFPDHIKQMPFVMPLYNMGLKRPEVFRLAFLAERFLSFDRNGGVRSDLHLPPGRVLSRSRTRELLPDIESEGLTGAAEWTEAVVPDTDSFFAAVMARTKSAGVDVLEDCSAEALILGDGRCEGLRIATPEGSEEIAAPKVVNATGPWSTAVARRLDPGSPELFHRVIGFNLLLDRPAPANFGLSLSPPGSKDAMLFVYPRGRQCFAGTWYTPCSEASDDPGPGPEVIDNFLTNLNAAAPTLNVRQTDIKSVSAGFLPGTHSGCTELADRDRVHDHGQSGGPKGLYSVAGIKLTTARSIAERVLRKADLL